MKRNCTLFALFFCLALTPFALPAGTTVHAMTTQQSELPWSTVQAILHQVEDHVAYTYSELVNLYETGRLTIEQVSEGYLVRILNADGSADTVLIANL